MGLTHAHSLSSARLHLWGKGQILPYAALISERVTRGLEPDRFAFILPPPGSCSVTNRGWREAVGSSLGPELPARQSHRSVCPPRAWGVGGSGQPLRVLLGVMAGTRAALCVTGAGLGAVSPSSLAQGTAVASGCLQECGPPGTPLSQGGHVGSARTPQCVPSEPGPGPGEAAVGERPVCDAM